MKLARWVMWIFDHTISWLMFLAASLIIFIMLIVGAEVVMRYFFHRPMLGVIEISQYSLLYITFLGTAWVLKREGHVKMDMLVGRLTPRAQDFVNIVTSIFGAITCLVVAWFGAQTTWNAFQEGSYEYSILEVPTALILLPIPVGSSLLFIQFLRRTYGYLTRLASPDKE